MRHNGTDHSSFRPPCSDPSDTPSYKWAALEAMVGALNELDAPYNIHGGTLLGLARTCSIFDGDIDFVVEHGWFEEHHSRASKAFREAGFAMGASFGALGETGYEEAQHHMTLLQGGSKISLVHERGFKVDLFTIRRFSDKYVWGLWVHGTYHPCSTESTGTSSYDWLGLHIRIPVPVEGALTSLYGSDFMTPQPWTWDIEPFTKGSCQRMGVFTELEFWREAENPTSQFYLKNQSAPH